ncbi:MAG: nucleotidyltransferase domain-containing protein [Muribaculum sp.]|nr:nucleotidyltransferase domain-containing protein [Muribaculum sp.]
MVDKSRVIIKEISQLARQMFTAGTGTVYLYGSQARGDNSPRSDWDLLVITDDSITTDDDFRHFAFPFAEIGWRHGEQITPLHYTQSQWDAQKGTAFYNNVISEAIRL